MHAIQVRSIPEDLYNKLKTESERHHRSIAGEITYILEKHLNAYPETAEKIFDGIDAVREQIDRNYGKSQSSVQSIREDREQ